MARPLRRSVDIYDAATGHLTEIYAHTGSTVIEDETYSYDIWGSRTERDDVLHNEVECFCVLRGKNNAFFGTIIQVPF